MPVRIRDKDKGFKALVESIGEMGGVVIGVQGKEADETYPDSSMTVGTVAKMHELGLGVPKRSWLVSYVDENESRLKREAGAQMRAVLARRKTRNQALIELGYKWTKEVRDRVAEGNAAGPPLAESTRAKKGHGIKLVETYRFHNAISYKVYLPRFKSIKNKVQRAAARGGK